jgi:hypothetical protein
LNNCLLTAHGGGAGESGGGGNGGGGNNGAAASLQDISDRFDLTALIGRGAYGSVYSARDRLAPDGAAAVALKAISLADADARDLGRVQAEVATLAECRHPNVVRYVGAYRAPGALWIAMEHCGGGSVSDLVAAHGGGLPEPAIAAICAEALKVSVWGGGVVGCVCGMQAKPTNKINLKKPQTNTENNQPTNKQPGPCVPARAGPGAPRHQERQHPAGR